MDDDILDQPEHEARVQLRAADFEIGFALDGRPQCQEIVARGEQRLPGQGGNFACHPQDIGNPGDIGRDGDIQYGIAHIIYQRHTHRGIGIQNNHALVLF